MLNQDASCFSGHNPSWKQGQAIHQKPCKYFSFKPVLHEWYVLPCMRDDAYKRTLAANRKEQHMWRQGVICLAC